MDNEKANSAIFQKRQPFGSLQPATGLGQDTVDPGLEQENWVGHVCTCAQRRSSPENARDPLADFVRAWMPRSTRIDHRVQLGLGMEVRATDRVFILYMMCLFILADSESASLVRASENNTIQHNIYIYIER